MADRDELDWIKRNEPERLKDVKKSQIKPFEWDFMQLTEIKGIGPERAKDIQRIYKSKEELIQALKEDKVSLRNDIVKKLKSYFKIK